MPYSKEKTGALFVSMQHHEMMKELATMDHRKIRTATELMIEEAYNRRLKWKKVPEKG